MLTFVQQPTQLIYQRRWVRLDRFVDLCRHLLSSMLLCSVETPEATCTLKKSTGLMQYNERAKAAGQENQVARMLEIHNSWSGVCGLEHGGRLN